MCYYNVDGAGTKSFGLYVWRETGDMSVWKGIAQDAVVMNTDDLLCWLHREYCYQVPLVETKQNTRRSNRSSDRGYGRGFRNVEKQGIDIISTGGETADVGD